ncbi:MFS transporter [Pseudoclavibacter chungangensis]|uniref:MFS transporter n=1 Tax=Pseudoclavibacter chungangensis TaxID=587635 RepID=A0A7J5BMB1_9MICO|nr:MFS transporter [Pseudoclavibacter chungangensis]KAB1652491.1 MFS transporter [Pseudoclavibacter chungangensis]NYJ66079.1 putative MFS transporter [Pseudoclavibacter chungangensis]
MTDSTTTPDASGAPLTRTERLDRLPFTRRHGKLLVGSGIGWALDAMDVGLISFVMAALAVQWQLDHTTISWIGSIGFVGMAIGATLGGLVADKLGRRQVFAITLLVYGVATGASALVGSVAALIVLRFVVGLGLGAELPVASTLVSEYAPRRIRGRVVVLLEAFWAVGWILAACIGAFIIPLSDDGWRWALLVGIVPAVYALVVRFGLPESVRFLESKGRTAEAERAVREFEASAGITAGDVERDSAAPATEVRIEETETEPTAPVPRASIWSRPLRGRTLALWIVWFCINLSYYGAFVWIPTLLVARGFDLVRAFEFTLVITLAQLPGYLVAAWLIERIGRRITLAVFLVGSAGAAAFYGLATTEPLIIAAGMLLSFFNLGAWGALYAIGPELYPTSVRGTGTGAAAGFGRIASIIAPLIVPPLVALGGGAGAGGELVVFGLFALAFLVAAVAAFTLPERMGRALDEVEPNATDGPAEVPAHTGPIDTSSARG